MNLSRRDWTYWLASGMIQPEPVKWECPKCDRCGGELELEGATDGDGRWLWRRQLPTRGPPAANLEASRGRASIA